MKTKKITEAEFEDATIVAYLNLKGHKISPFKTSAGRIAFFVQGEDIQVNIEEIYDNKPVGILDFIKSLKAVKSTIFSLKALK